MSQMSSDGQSTYQLTTDEESEKSPSSRHAGDWTDFLAAVQATQIVLLRRDGVIDDAAANAILRAIDVGRMGSQTLGGSVWQQIAEREDRLENNLPAEIAGASALGRTRSETIATSLRMSWRARAAGIGTDFLQLREALAELAQVHTVTVMGGFVDHKAAAPTTLGHFLGGVIGGLETTWPRLTAGIDSIDRSPMGAGLLVGEVFGVDRIASAELLGFTGSIENTVDAAGSVEDLVSMLEALSAQISVVRRFVSELLTWIRTDPTSFFIDERWELVPEPAHAAHAVSARLEELEYRARNTALDTVAVVDLLRGQPYGPISANWSQIAPSIDRVIFQTSETVLLAAEAVKQALIVNRAYLANRAGRLYSTASDVASFLMEDQNLTPAAAQQIAGMAVATLKEQRLEAAQITPDIIDSAAVLVIGQELKVEMETLGRFIAPRRYIERRDVLGSPKSDRTRTWLANVQQRMSSDRESLAIRTQRWQRAASAVEQMISESAESREG